MCKHCRQGVDPQTGLCIGDTGNVPEGTGDSNPLLLPLVLLAVVLPFMTCAFLAYAGYGEIIGLHWVMAQSTVVQTGATVSPTHVDSEKSNNLIQTSFANLDDKPSELGSTKFPSEKESSPYTSVYTSQTRSEHKYTGTLFEDPNYLFEIRK